MAYQDFSKENKIDEASVIWQENQAIRYALSRNPYNVFLAEVKRTIKGITDNAVHPNGETVFKEYTQVERIEHNRYRLLVKTSITVVGLACRIEG